jgi:hypothetical protein
VTILRSEVDKSTRFQDYIAKGIRISAAATSLAQQPASHACYFVRADNERRKG